MLGLEKIKKVYFIGIGGIMMSALARYFLALGKEVSGSDREMSEITEKLEKLGAKAYKGHSAVNIENGIDLVVYSEAIDGDNVELIKAKDLNLPCYTAYQFLGELSKDKYTIAISGMHGKSTSTSIIGLIMEAAGLDPTVFIGTQVKEFDGNFRFGHASSSAARRAGKSDYLVSEACEYRDNFLNYKSNIGVVTNIETEHLDYFKNITGVKKSFKQFVSQIKDDGWLVYNGDDKNVEAVISGHKRNRVSFGIGNKEVDILAENIEAGDNGDIQFEIKSKKLKEFDGIRFSLKVPGRFNVYNALAAIAVAAILEVKVQVVQENLAKFSGVWRRFEFKGEKDGIQYWDDYAHHPTEIKATLEAVKEKFGSRKVWIVYQPHLYSRTKDFMAEFVKSLSAAENLILAPIYAAREKNKWGVSSKDLAKKINQAVYLDSFDEIKKYLADNVKPGEVVMTMGAGDVYKVLN